MTEEKTTTRRPWVPWLIVGAPLVLVAAGVIATHTESHAGLTAAAELVKERYRAGDMVIFVGASADDAGYLMEGLPFLVMAPGGVPPTRGFEWVWVIDARVKPEAPPFPALGAIDQLENLGTTRVGLHRVAETRPPPLAAARLDGARVTFTRAGAAPSNCARGPDGFFHCPGPEWLRAGPLTGLPVHGQRYDCLHVHPSPEGTMALKLAPAEIPGVLVLRTALADAARGVSPVHVTVEVAGARMARFDHTAAPGWEQHPIPMGAHAGQTEAMTLRFSVDAPGRHHFCVEIGP